MTSKKDSCDLDPWAEDVDAQIDRIVNEGGKPLAKLRAFLEEGIHSPDLPWEGTEAMKRKVRCWREEQSRLLDALLPERGSLEEAQYIAAIDRGRTDADAGRLIDHHAVIVDLDRITAEARQSNP